MGRDLVSLLIARTFFLAGTLIITTFLYYLTRDVLAAENPQRTTGLLYAVAIAGALLFALPVGRLTETVGEVPILFGSGSAIAVVAVLFLVAGSSRPAVAIACMLVYGACSAALIGSGISFLVRLVPHPAVAGRVMAVFTAATFVSQLLASLTGAALLDPLNRARAGAGYLGLVAALELYFALGAVFLLRVGARKTSAERP
jgi:MFS family permease